MNDKFENQPNFNLLDKKTQDFFYEISKKYFFSFQELKQLIDFCIDFKMWQEKPIQEYFKQNFKDKTQAFNEIKNAWNKLKIQTHSYKTFKAVKSDKKYSFYKLKNDKLGFGSCPVASEATRCCNLLTLDAVNSCGFDCSYCSIQSFYKQDKIGFDENFAKNLKNIKLNPNEIYHIGTGQSSDSLMWGNKFGILEALLEFAKENQNVILEFKSKSKNISFLLENEVPKNIICTWSLNTPTIIQNEEHLTASLQDRLSCAKALAQKGVLVGFHFHPMVKYEGYLQEYGEVFQQILKNFNPKDVALISFGTLTFIKPVISKIRKRNFYTKITEIPFREVNKKLTYTFEEKKEMFSYAYNSFKSWHDKVFFYMCMEEKDLWKEVFSYEYQSNEEMEVAMKTAYLSKIRSKI